eukprot:jgi/Picsp_1/1242/NSC_04723-R1_---NA---
MSIWRKSRYSAMKRQRKEDMTCTFVAPWSQGTYTASDDNLAVQGLKFCPDGSFPQYGRGHGVCASQQLTEHQIAGPSSQRSQGQASQASQLAGRLLQDLHARASADYVPQGAKPALDYEMFVESVHGKMREIECKLTEEIGGVKRELGECRWDDTKVLEVMSAWTAKYDEQWHLMLAMKNEVEHLKTTMTSVRRLEERGCDVSVHALNSKETEASGLATARAAASGGVEEQGPFHEPKGVQRRIRRYQLARPIRSLSVNTSTNRKKTVTADAGRMPQ